MSGEIFKVLFWGLFLIWIAYKAYEKYNQEYNSRDRAEVEAEIRAFLHAENEQSDPVEKVIDSDSPIKSALHQIND